MDVEIELAILAALCHWNVWAQRCHVLVKEQSHCGAVIRDNGSSGCPHIRCSRAKVKCLQDSSGIMTVDERVKI